MEEKTVFFESEIRSWSDAGAFAVRKMIEEDLLRLPEFDKNTDPYKWLAAKMGKSSRTIRGWAFDWKKESGNKPTVMDLIELTHLTKSARLINLMESLIKDATPEQQELNHSDLMKHISFHIRKLAATIDKLAEKNK